MKITEILKDSEYKLELFSQKAIENLEEKNCHSRRQNRTKLLCCLPSAR